MPSDSTVHGEPRPYAEGAGVIGLLDSVLGFGVWAAHLLIVYVSSAVACQLGLAARPAGVQRSVVGALCVITLVAAAVVVLHGVRHYRQRGERPDRGFLARIAVCHDAVAALAILWQLMPLLMVPLCR